LCFLYALLAGVIYLQVAPKRYQSRDGDHDLPGSAACGKSGRGAVDEPATHIYMLNHERLHESVVQRLSQRRGLTKLEVGTVSYAIHAWLHHRDAA
jgi:hypothetical protein